MSTLAEALRDIAACSSDRAAVKTAMEALASFAAQQGEHRLHSIAESARCLGVAQAKDDKDAITYWSAKVDELTAGKRIEQSQVRDAALEEAAKECERTMTFPEGVVRTIRALKSQAPSQSSRTQTLLDDANALLSTLQLDLAFATKDADRWRAFVGSARIKMQGSAGLNEPEPNNYAHIGLEIWTTYDRNYSQALLDQMDKGNALGRDWLTKYADIAVAAMIDAAMAKEPQQ